MTTVANPARVRVPGRLAFPALFKPKAVEKGGKEKYSAAIAIDPSNKAVVAALDAAVKHVAAAKWPGKNDEGKNKADVILAELHKKGKVGFKKEPRTNADGEVYDGFEDMFSLNASSDAAPTVLDADKTPLGEKSGRPYGGCYVVMNVEAWAQDNDYGRRINFTLRGVQFAKAGDAFGGGAPASEDEFEDISTTEEDLVG
jgi:hypothetical protein